MMPRKFLLRGFTLLELLVSMTVLALLLVILLSMVDGATRIWRQSENQVDSYREARAALNVIAADLASMHVSDDTNFFQVEHQELKFLSSIPRRYQEEGENKSEICEISYSWAYERPDVLRSKTDVPESYNLYRTFTTSDRSFQNVLSDKPLAGPGSRELLARNISDFQIRAYTLDATGLPKKFEASPETPMPDVIQITLKALDNSTAQKMSQADWHNETSILHKQNVRVFTARVRVPPVAASPTPTPEL